MKVTQYAAPTIEPITLAELKLHLRLDSGSLADNLDETQSIAPGSYGIDYELLTLDVAPGGTGWAVGDTLTGATSTKTCVVVAVITTKTYIVKSRSGAFTLGEIISNGTNAADQGAAYPTFATGYTILGTAIDVLGQQAIVSLASGTNAATGTLDVKIQESDDGTSWVDWTAGAFTQVTTTNDNATYEKAYTGIKQYIRTVAKVLLAACEFGTLVIRLNPMFAEDALLNDIIVAAREHVEDVTRWALLTQTWDYFPPNWPGRHGYRGIPSTHSGQQFQNSYLENYFIKLPFGNLQTIAHVKWKDVNGVETTLDEDVDYIVETNGDQCGRIVLPWGIVWPTGMLWPSNPISIRFICGWTTAALVPYKIKAAMKMIAADLYEHREFFIEARSRTVIAENEVVERLLSSARLWDEFE